MNSTLSNIIADRDTVVEIRDVWKRYYLGTTDRSKTLKSAVLNRFQGWSNREAYWALQGINLEIKQGRTLGLIGNNGAGKSTLLRLISDLSRPTRGKINRYGRIGSLLELGAGFNMEFTGRENVITGSILAGLTRKEAEKRLEKVVAFAELEDFVDSPVRTYSSGMFIRLAFSTEINLDPDILLIDEVLAVGDLAFQGKCLNYLKSMKDQGKTIIVVSHSMDQIETVCDEVVWLEHGKIRAQGEVKEVIQRYKNRIFEKAASLSGPETEARLAADGSSVASGLTNNSFPGQDQENVAASESALFQSINQSVVALEAEQPDRPTAPLREYRTGKQPLKIESVELLNEHDQPVNLIISGDPLILRIIFHVYEPVNQPVFMAGIQTEDGLKCYEISTDQDGAAFGTLSEGTGEIKLYFGSIPLVRGNYFFWVGAYSSDWEQTYDYRHNVCQLTVEGNTPGSGILYLPHRWQI
jgi:lipopolysaccharide transport system ATP-binding protein